MEKSQDEWEYIDPEQGFDWGEQVFFRKLFLMVDKRKLYTRNIHKTQTLKFSIKKMKWYEMLDVM